MLKKKFDLILYFSNKKYKELGIIFIISPIKSKKEIVKRRKDDTSRDNYLL